MITAIIILMLCFLLGLLLSKFIRLKMDFKGSDWKSSGKGKGMIDAIFSMFRRQTSGTENAAAAPNPTPERRSDPVYTDPDMPGLPESARERVRTVNKYLADIRQRIGDHPLATALVIEMEQMRDMHLPKLLQSYVEIPESHRREIFTKTGKSASFHLNASLDAMGKRLKEIDRDLAQEQIDTFSDNTRFINSTYGQGRDPLS